LDLKRNHNMKLEITLQITLIVNCNNDVYTRIVICDVISRFNL